MKTTALAALVVISTVPRLQAEVTAAPLDLATGPSWRTGAPEAVEADHEYGSDGYVLYGVNLPDGSFTGNNYDTGAANTSNVHQLPAFISVAAAAGETFGLWSGNGNCGQIENPANGNALTNAAALLRGPHASGDPLVFTLTRHSDTAFRLTVMIGLFSDGGFANNAFTLSVNAGSAGSATADTSSAPVGGAAGTPGMMYQTFAIGQGTDPITVTIGPGSAAHENIAGFAFDGAAAAPPVFVTPPQSTTVVTGGPAFFQASAAGAGVTYQWQRGTTDIPGATSPTLTFTTVAGDDGATFRAVATNGEGSVPSDPATLTLVAPAPNTADFRAAVAAETSKLAYFPFDGDSGQFVTNTANNAFGGVIGLGALTGRADRVVGTTALAGTANLTADPAWELPDGSGTVEAIFFQSDAAAYNPCLFSVRQTPTVTRISLHAGANGTQLFFWNGAQAAVWDTPVSTIGRRSHVAFVFDADTVTAYFDGTSLGTQSVPLGTSFSLPAQIAAADPDGLERLPGAIDELVIYEDPLAPETILAHATAWFGAAPQVTQPPVAQSVVDGGPAHFAVVASGSDLSFQWEKNGVPIPGATLSSVTFAATAADDGAAIRCVVTNTAGTATSDAATLTVTAPAPPSAAYRAAVTAEASLIAHFPFDGDTAPAITNTVSAPNGGEVRAGSSLTGQSGRVAGTTALSGTAGLVPDAAWEFADDATGTVEALVHQSATAAYNPCFFALRDGTGVRYSLHGSSVGTKLYFWNGVTAAEWDTPRSMVGRLSHIAIVFESGNVTAWFDGRNLGTQAVPLGSGSGLPAQIGSSTDTSAELWPGTIDEVALYADALSPDAIATHANAWFGAPPAPRITAVSVSSGLVFMTVPSASGYVYSLEWSPDLYSWQPVTGSELPGSDGDLVFSTPVNGAEGYHRVRISR